MVLPSAGGAFKNYKLGAGVDSGLELFAFGIQILCSTLARMVRYWREEDLDSFTLQGLQMKNICIPHGNELFLYKTMLIWQKNIFV